MGTVDGTWDATQIRGHLLDQPFGDILLDAFFLLARDKLHLVGLHVGQFFNAAFCRQQGWWNFALSSSHDQMQIATDDGSLLIDIRIQQVPSCDPANLWFFSNGG